MDTSHPYVSGGTPYANDRDEETVTIRISAQTRQNRDIVNWGARRQFGVLDTSGFKAQRTSNGGSNALDFSSVPSSVSFADSTPNSFTLAIPGIRAFSPLRENGSLRLTGAGSPIQITNVPYHFRKPFVGRIETNDPTKGENDWTGKPSVGTKLKYRVMTTPRSNLAASALPGYSLDNFAPSVEATSERLEVQGTEVVLSSLSNATEGTVFSTRLNTSAGGTDVSAP